MQVKELSAAEKFEKCKVKGMNLSRRYDVFAFHLVISLVEHVSVISD